MTVLQNISVEGHKCDCDCDSVISGSTTFSNEQPIYSVPTIMTVKSSTQNPAISIDDKRSIISSSSADSENEEGGKKHSVFPNIKKFIQYNVFENEKDDSRVEAEKTTTLFVQKWLDAIAGLDIVLFAISIILAISTEKYLCYDGPVRLDYTRNVFLSNSTSDEVGGSAYSLTAFEFVKDTLLRDTKYDSPLTYNLIVIVLLAIGMAYFVTEIWLFCILTRIGREKYPSAFCMKWIFWRSIILTITLLISFSDVINAHQVTCSEVIVVPFQVVRMVIGGVPVAWVLCNKSQVGSNGRGFL